MDDIRRSGWDDGSVPGAFCSYHMYRLEVRKGNGGISWTMEAFIGGYRHFSGDIGISREMEAFLGGWRHFSGEDTFELCPATSNTI